MNGWTPLDKLAEAARLAACHAEAVTADIGATQAEIDEAEATAAMAAEAWTDAIDYEAEMGA